MLHLLTFQDSQLFSLLTNEESKSGLTGVPTHGPPLLSARSMNRSAILKRLHVRLLSYQFHHASKLLLAVQDSYAREFRMMRRKIRFPELTSWHTYTGTRKLELSAS
ncbi:hypothetical protein MJO28_015691 [Puccinia striiformis f. sp. tritici]|uniref:Uncharacterized protein n=1 Tax=Puccinia striiformis f. sp. tritici TaxID=168172 RepID=A0ACC0DQJ1_9BASI|nr:hypothetical protein MJO28_015691 [Puccinia striiformis f. sp. tritici]